MKMILLAAVLLLAGCDQMKERAGFPDPARMEAEGKAVGGACRNAGRGLEDCYRLNSGASKAAIYAGWKEMNEYMTQNKLEVIEPSIPSETAPGEKHKKAEGEEGDTEMPAAKKDAGH